MRDGGTPSTARRLALSLLVLMGALVGLEMGLRGVGRLVGLGQRSRGAAVSGSGSGGPVVLTIGDSVTQGIPEGRAHGWPVAFAQRSGATVHNLGAAGRDVAWMVRDFDRRRPALPARVDLIIAMIGHNDCAYLEDLASIHMPDAPGWLDQARRGLRTLTTYRVLLQVVTRLRPRPQAEVSSMRRPVDGARESAYCRARVATGIDALASRSADLGAELVVASYPVPDRKDTPGLRVNRFLDTLLEEGALARGLRFVDVRPCFEGAPAADWQQDGVHLTRSGYARLGECIAGGLGWSP